MTIEYIRSNSGFFCFTSVVSKNIVPLLIIKKNRRNEYLQYRRQLSNNKEKCNERGNELGTSSYS